MTQRLLDLALMLRENASMQEWEKHALLAGRLGYFAVHVPVAPGESLNERDLARLQEVAEPAMVVMDSGEDVLGVVRRNDPALVREVRRQMDGLEDQRPLVVAVPISIGRTLNEAMARAARDARFVGDAHPEVSGIYGTFEQAQEQVLDLARAGAEVLLVTVPVELDIADVLAQIKALLVGATPALFDK